MEGWRGQRRFGVTLDARYRAYYWPDSITVKCPHCRSRANFRPTVSDSWVSKGSTSFLAILPVGGVKGGHGSCLDCGRIFQTIDWPLDAYYCASVHGGEYWAWNDGYLQVLRARVAGDRVHERHHCMEDWRYHYFLTRLPKYVVLKRHRTTILRKIDQWLAESGGKSVRSSVHR